MMEEIIFDRNKWNFVNMTSPVDIEIVPNGNKSITLEEYNQFKEGHCLLSKFFIDTEALKVCVKLTAMESGAALGYYYGRGAWGDYLGVFIFGNSIELRIPSGVPQGDTFRAEGTKRYFVLERKEIVFNEGDVVSFEKKGTLIEVKVNQGTVIKYRCPKLPFIKEQGRFFLKSVNHDMPWEKSRTTFDGLYMDGISEGSSIKGKVIDSISNKAVANVSIHLPEFSDKWCMSDEKGNFIIPNMPYGNYHVVSGKEGYDMTTETVQHDGEPWCLSLHEENPYRTEDPRVNVKSNGHIKQLNGLWSFTFDEAEAGEREAWYLPDRTIFDKVINVPFSWTSLLGFGEGILAADTPIHQFNTYFSNRKEVGSIGWYKKTMVIPNNFDERYNTILHIGAVTGIAKIWLDGQYLVTTIDQYNELSVDLGQLLKGSTHTLVIRVDSDTEKYHLCTGKQGFWFSRCLGIWQNVWIENATNMTVKDHFCDVGFEDENLMKASVEIRVVLDIYGELQEACVKQEAYQIIPFVSKDIIMTVAQKGIYKIEFIYSAGEGRVPVSITSTNTISSILFEGTPSFELTDLKCLYMDLEQGENKMSLMGHVDELMMGSPSVMINEINVYSIETPQFLEIALLSPKGDTVFCDYVEPKICSETGMLIGKCRTVVNKPVLWNEKKPYMYTVKSTIINSEGRRLNTYESVLGIRSVKTDWALGHNEEEALIDEQYQYVYINNQATYIRGIMDQGYNPWGIYTYPFTENHKRGSMGYDIEMAQNFGYNLIRLHIKDNEPYWYRICDNQGVLVWDEVPPNFYEKHTNPSWRGMFIRQLVKTAYKHKYHPSIIAVSIFNESWGIEGDHERSPWEDRAGQLFIKNAFLHYKKIHKGTLVIDNSGYAKTSFTELIDHHSYPSGYLDSKSFWSKLLSRNFPKSSFNFFNRINKICMKNHNKRQLLQRNCRQPLDVLDYVGEEVQKGQPILISEFVHTDRNTRLLKSLPKIAGFIRMNLSSQENEDTSPLTAMRYVRDFGYVDSDFKEVGYSINNDADSIFIDSPHLRQIKAEEVINYDIYRVIRSGNIQEIDTEVRWSIAGIDHRGNIKKNLMSGTIDSSEKCVVREGEASCVGSITVNVPKEIQGLYIFVQLTHRGGVIAQDYVQLEVIRDQDLSSGLDVSIPSRVMTKCLYDSYSMDNRELFWLVGRGVIEYMYHWPTDILLEGDKRTCEKGYFHFEASACRYLEGTMVTQEGLIQSEIKVKIGGIFAGDFILEGHRSDEKALFSNSSSMTGKEFLYKESGKYGYGQHIKAPLNVMCIEKIKESIEKKETLVISFESLNNGMIIYGNRMGRYGFKPYIELVEK